MVIGKVKFPPPQKVQQNGKGWQFGRKCSCWADMLNHCVHWGRAMGLWKGGEVGPREGGLFTSCCFTSVTGTDHKEGSDEAKSEKERM